MRLVRLFSLSALCCFCVFFCKTDKVEASPTRCVFVEITDPITGSTQASGNLNVEFSWSGLTANTMATITVTDISGRARLLSTTNVTLLAGNGVDSVAVILPVNCTALRITISIPGSASDTITISSGP